jgi:hypothetical protein
MLAVSHVHLHPYPLKEQLVVRKDMDVNEHERLPTLQLDTN